MTPVFRSPSPILRSAALCSTILLSAVLTGCATAAEPHVLNSPSTAEAPASPSPTERDYTTDLQLSEDEKKAVEEALVALQKYVDVTNEVFGSGGQNSEMFEEVAKDKALLIGKNEAEGLVAGGTAMTGKLRLEGIGVENINLALDADTPIPYVTLHACIPASAYSFTDVSEERKDELKHKVDTFEFVVAQYEGRWFVSEQDLWNESCDL